MPRIPHPQEIWKDPSLRRGALAGVLASSAYLVEMFIDMKLAPEEFNDMKMLGGVFTKDQRLWWPLGLINHFTFGTLLGMAYTKAYPWLAGPGWLRGLSFALFENTMLWPLTFFVDKYHPRVLDGSLPKLNKPLSFTTQALRHIAFGLVLGGAYKAEEK